MSKLTSLKLYRFAHGLSTEYVAAENAEKATKYYESLFTKGDVPSYGMGFLNEDLHIVTDEETP